MFKRTLTVLALSGAIALGGCAGVNLQNEVSTIEQQVQADANVLCGFIPTAATIAAFIPGFGTIAASAATIAEGICTSIAQAPVVQPQSAIRMRSVASGADVQVTVAKTPNGPVAVVGHFTR